MILMSTNKNLFHKSISLFLIGLVCLVSFGSFCQEHTFKIAFGSCANQDKPMPVFKTIAKHHPDLFIFLGDNIYADTYKMRIMRKKYRKLKKNRDFKTLKKTTQIIATWDDHDYGQNDSGRHFPQKEESKKIFLRFFKEPRDSERWNHKGIYTSYLYTVNTKKIQIILLDLRTFRDNLIPYNGSLDADSSYHYSLEYSPCQNEDSTLLGKEQWQWLSNELTKSADIRIIGSSTQFLTQYNGYETWANFPYEQKRMLDLIKSKNVNGVFFISGDVHYAELSMRKENLNYPIYDLTCSGLTEKWKFAPPNIYRIGKPVMENHFGIINLDFSQPKAQIALQVWDVENHLRIEKIIHLTDLQAF